MVTFLSAFTVTSVDSVKPTVTPISPIEGEIDVSVYSQIHLVVTDDMGGSGINIKTLKVFVGSIAAFDGTKSAVIDGDPLTYVGGWVEGFTVASIIQQMTPSVVPHEVYGPRYELWVDRDSPLSDGAVISVRVVASDYSSNGVDRTYSFTTEDLQAPEVGDLVPYFGFVGAARDVVIEMVVSDDWSGVDLKTLQVSVGGVLAYDGTVGSVIEADPATWMSGFQTGFTGAGSAIEYVSASRGYKVSLQKNVLFDLYKVVTMSIDAEDKAGNAMSYGYYFVVSTEDNVFEVRISGQVVGYSKVSFVRTGTSTVDFTVFASEVRGVVGSEYISVYVRPGVDILVDQQYDLRVEVGMLSDVLVYNGTSAGVEFTS